MKDDTSLAVLKPLSATWINSAFDCLRQENRIVRGGFIKAEILEALNGAESEAEDCGSECDTFED